MYIFFVGVNTAALTATWHPKCFQKEQLTIRAPTGSALAVCSTNCSKATLRSDSTRPKVTIFLI